MVIFMARVVTRRRYRAGVSREEWNGTLVARVALCVCSGTGCLRSRGPGAVSRFLCSSVPDPPGMPGSEPRSGSAGDAGVTAQPPPGPRKSVDAESEVVRAGGPSLGAPAPPPSGREKYRGFGLPSATRVSGGVARPGGSRSGPTSSSPSAPSGSGPGRARPGRPPAGWVGVCCTPTARRP
jgi:hypothetical protein